MNEINGYIEKIFENIKHIDENGNEYWNARELQYALDQKEWRKFEGTIEKAKIVCDISGINTNDHFVGADKMRDISKKSKRTVLDYKIYRYYFYLILQK